MTDDTHNLLMTVDSLFARWKVQTLMRRNERVYECEGRASLNGRVYRKRYAGTGRTPAEAMRRCIEKYQRDHGRGADLPAEATGARPADGPHLKLTE